MKSCPYNFNRVKNAKLKLERGISFEEIIAAIEKGKLLDIIKHNNQKKFGHQKIYVIDIENYVYLVPFVKNDNEIFLKTIFPSRKMTKKYRHMLNNRKNHENEY